HGLEPESAVELLERGVAVGHPGAMQELARLFAKGGLVLQDRQKAIELARKGADRGHQGSTSLLKELLQEDEANLTIIEKSIQPVADKKEG
ncbi:MAG: hypothetical protein AAFY24_01225, partial [Pseudomonadota bacterium]